MSGDVGMVGAILGIALMVQTVGFENQTALVGDANSSMV